MAEEKEWMPLELVKVSADYLASKKCPTPRLDAEVLLCNVMGLERRVDLYAGFERKISGKELATYRELIRRRAAREPVSRILGQRDFMGMTFDVTPDVLSPRPETEILVETALEKLRPPKQFVPDEEDDNPHEVNKDDDADETGEQSGERVDMSEELEQLLDSYADDIDSEDDLERDEPLRPAVKKAQPVPAKVMTGSAARKGATGNAAGNVKGNKPQPGAETGPEITVLDLGTGSGCIAASMAALLYTARVTAVDASPKALAIAKKNAARLGVAERIAFRQGDWFSACPNGELFDVILSNPPYLIDGDEEIWPEVSGYDPPLALYGGRDGLDCYRRIIPDAPEWLKPEGWLLFEVGAGQAATVAEMMERRGFRNITTANDYGGVVRVVAGKAPEPV